MPGALAQLCEAEVCVAAELDANIHQSGVNVEGALAFELHQTAHTVAGFATLQDPASAAEDCG